MRAFCVHGLVTCCLLLAAALSSACAPRARPSTDGNDAAARARYEHRIAARDELRITVVGHPDAGGQQRVSDLGSIVHPWLGDVPAAGRTESELAEDLRRRLADGYLKEPLVTVALAAYGESVYVMGEVARPGAYPFQPNLTVVQALALAGGATPRAAEAKTRVLRPTATGAEVVPVQPMDKLRPDDVLVVPERVF